MASRAERALISQFNVKGVAQPNEYLQLYINPKNIYEWYAIVRNLRGPEGELEGGEYLFKVSVDKDKPLFEPPKFHAMTPNGIYGINQTVCISIGEFHRDQFQATLGIPGFINELANGLMSYKDLGTGIAIIQHQTSTKQKRRFAQESVEYNKAHYGELVANIKDSYAEYSKKWDQSKMSDETKIKLGFMKLPEVTPEVAPEKTVAQVADEIENLVFEDDLEDELGDEVEDDEDEDGDDEDEGEGDPEDDLEDEDDFEDDLN